MNNIILTAVDQAPRLSDKVPEFPSMWDWLRALPGSFESQLFIGLMIAGTVGMIAHYLLKWARGEIRENLFCYLWNNQRSTWLSFFTYVGLAIGAIGSGAFVTELGTFVGWKMVFWMGVTNGFTVDAIANKTTRAVWTDREREAKTSGVKP